jgi:NADPH:quinone reductase-like Zn-dependent oxidoreductase
LKSVRLDDSALGPLLVPNNAPQPQPGPGELLIRVCAAGVTPTELGWYPTSHTKSGDKRVGAIPGHEFSGVAAGAGEDAGAFRSGQEVFGMNDWYSNGAMAEYCVAPSSAVALKPSRLSHNEAASVPIGALTAWQGLFDRARLQAGERVLVHGGAGAVGVYVVQLARLHGAHVVATASGKNAAFVRELGAEQVIDYQAAQFEQIVTGMDVVFDTVGGETLQRSWSVLKTHGRMVTIVSDEQNAIDARIKESFFIMEPNGTQLTSIANLLQSGRLRAVVDAVVPLSQAPDAYAGRIPRQGRGKVVVAVQESEGLFPTA